MSDGHYHGIKFDLPVPKDIYIDDQPYKVPFNKTIRIRLNGRPHELGWGGPGFEVIIDGRPYELQFDKPAREIVIGTRPHFVFICGPPPDVKILGRLPPDLLDTGSIAAVQAGSSTNGTVSNVGDNKNDALMLIAKQRENMFSKPPPPLPKRMFLNSNS